MWLDPWQIQLPAQVLTVDFPHVRDEEGIVVPCLADVVVNRVDAFSKRVSNQSLRIDAMLLMALVMGRMVILRARLDWDGCIFLSTSGGRRCHAHAVSRLGKSCASRLAKPGLRGFERLELETDFLPGPPRLSLGERKSPSVRPMRQLSV